MSRISRRAVIGSAAGAALAALAPPGAAEVDVRRWALLADPHIAGDPSTVREGVNVTDHLRQVVAEVLARPARAAGMIVAGDCAATAGLPEEYAQLAGLLKPCSAAGLPVHLALGDHDHHDNFRAALGGGAAAALEGRHVAIIETPRANWFVLDSLAETNKPPGRLGEAQRRWLTAALDARVDRPALVVVHHHPLFTRPGDSSGLQDTVELFALLGPRKHVKAVLYGHVHKWERRIQDGIHVVGLPPVSYPLAPGDPCGWVEARLGSHALGLELRCLDPAHPAHGQTVNLPWREPA